MTLPFRKILHRSRFRHSNFDFLIYLANQFVLWRKLDTTRRKNNTNSLEATMVRFMLLGSTCMHALQVIVIICRHSLRQTAELMGIVSMQNEEGCESTK